MAKKRIPIDWNKIEESNILVQKDNEEVNIQFLNEGFVEQYEVSKDVFIPKYVFDVKDLDDDNKEKEWSILSNRGINKIKALAPLKGKKYNVLKDAYGNEVFDKDYHFTPIK